MEKITSRKNQFIAHVRSLAGDKEYRNVHGEYICDGIKTLREAVQFGAEITSILWKEVPAGVDVIGNVRQYTAPEELFDYASPMKNSPGPLFTVRIPTRTPARVRNAVILEGVQDPGNVGTVIRTANAFGIGAVVLTENCADLYNAKTVRSTMGAIFRQNVIELCEKDIPQWLRENGLKLYGAALSEKAGDIRDIDVTASAVAIGSEGRGLSREFLDMCDGELIIPMRPDSESLNAAVAASVVMWEMSRAEL